MQISDWINVALCILSFILAAISVITVVITLRQNAKMISNSTRPYVVCMGEMTNCQSPQFYLVIKNYGNSGARIKSIEFSIDVEKICYHNLKPFDNPNNSFIAPNQSIICALNNQSINENKIEEFDVRIVYSDDFKTYDEKYRIGYKFQAKNVHIRAATEGKELRAISYSLQELVERNF